MRMVKVTAWGWCSVSSPCKPKLVSHLKTFLKKCYYFNAINNDHDNDAIPVMVTMMTIAMNLVSQLSYLAVRIDEISLIAGI